MSKGYAPGMLEISTRPDKPMGTDVGDFYLPHMCDEWIIGDRASAIALLKDLTHALGGKTSDDL